MFEIDEIWDFLDSGLSVFKVWKLSDSQSLGFFETLDFQNLHVLEIRVDNKFGILEIRYLQNLDFLKLEFSKIFPKFAIPKIRTSQNFSPAELWFSKMTFEIRNVQTFASKISPFQNLRFPRE